MKLSEVLIKPILSEKVNKQTEKANRYAFVVNRKANKLEIKKAVEEFLLKYQIPFDEISGTKPAAKCYIDDRAVRFRDWRQTIKDIENFEEELNKGKNSI